jgi:diguanylate cyclase (GGDEF)-like protein
MKAATERTDPLSDAELAIFDSEDDGEGPLSVPIRHPEYSLAALADRPAFEDAATRHVAFARRHGHPLCFALIAFDERADSEGSLNGDEALTQATLLWREVLRTEDLVGRWGANDFAILLPNCDTASAVQLCWRLREQTPEGLSFSAGLVSYEGTETFGDLIERAETCLDQAIAKGRDRTVAEGLVDLD